MIKIVSIEEILEISTSPYTSSIVIYPYLIVHLNDEKIKIFKDSVIIEKTEEQTNYFIRGEKGFLNTIYNHKIFLTEEYYNKCYIVNKDNEKFLITNKKNKEISMLLDDFKVIINKDYKVDNYNSLTLTRKLF